jgi:RHS repeat-associated protein
VYDAVGNFRAMSHRGCDPANSGWTRAYVYNEPSLLEPGKQSNRLTSTTVGTTTETYSAGGNGYDPHGNMLRMPHLQTMQWDFKDQLQMTQRQAVNAADGEGVQRQGERTWYVYDAGGQRVRKVTHLATGKVKDERIYLGGFEVYRRYGVNPLVRETLHVMGDKQRIALVETRTDTQEQLIRYQFTNHLGSASLELDDQAQIISYEEYTPYGSTSYQAMSGTTQTPKRHRYTGKERDEESGFYYHGARYYASWLGRWVSCDPSGLAGDLNLYCAMGCSPVVLSDMNGRNPELGQQIADAARIVAPAGASLPFWAKSLWWFVSPPTLGASSTVGTVGTAAIATEGSVVSGGVGLASAGPIAAIVLAFGASLAVFIGSDKYTRLAADLNQRRQHPPQIFPGQSSDALIDAPGAGDQSPKDLPSPSSAPRVPVSEPGGGDAPKTLPGTSPGRRFEFAPQIVRGGAKSRISKGKDIEGHHEPSWDAIKKSGKYPELTYGKAPALGIEKGHHRQTPTHGGNPTLGAVTVMNRMLQRLLIQEGQFDVAQDLGLAELRKEHGKRYDKHIVETLDYTVSQGLRQDYGEFSRLFDKEMSKLDSQRLALKLFK